MQKDTLYLLDGTGLCYRSFYAIKLSTSKGFPTGAVFGLYTTLKKIMKQFSPRYLGVCFDVSRKTVRQEKFEAYKIQRPPAPDEFVAQLFLIRKLVSSLGLQSLEKEGYEADDVIATLTRQAVAEENRVVIVTSDKDMFQLLQLPGVEIYDPGKDKRYTAETFRVEYGFEPGRIIDYLALMGDASDNIPGAKGIGKVGAAKLIKEYGDIDSLFKKIDTLPARTRELLTAQKKAVLLSRELVTLMSPHLFLNWRQCLIREPDYAGLQSIFQECEFRTLLKDLPATAETGDIKVIARAGDELVQKLKKTGQCAVYFREGNFFIQEKEDLPVYALDIDQAGPVLSAPGIKKISYDLKPMLNFCRERCEVNNVSADIKIASYLIDPGIGDLSVENLVAHFLDQISGPVEDRAVPLFILRLYPVLTARLKKDRLQRLFEELEMPLVDVLSQMESAGITIDKKYLSSFSKKIEKKISDVTVRIYREAGKEFNLNSPKQLSAVLFEHLRLPPVKKTKTGYSTNEEVLTRLAKDYPIARLILEYRELSKLYSTYLTPFLREVEQQTGKVHATFNQTTTLTGRLSSSSPNLQNIPAKGGFARQFRKAFIPSDKHGLILACDYSQIELRVLAHFSGDRTLLKAFREDTDIHTYTASLLFGHAEDKVSAREREVAKRVNFGIIYGMSPYGLARELSLSFEEASSFIDSYFSRYPGVKRFIDETISEAQCQGQVRTFLGRVRYLEHINSTRQDIHDFSRRAAINTPIQGSAADLIKLAMIEVHRALQQSGLDSKMIIQIHDELVFDVVKDELEELRRLVQEKMEGAGKLRVPLKVNVKAGKNWGDLEKI